MVAQDRIHKLIQRTGLEQGNILYVKVLNEAMNIADVVDEDELKQFIEQTVEELAYEA